LAGDIFTGFGAAFFATGFSGADFLAAGRVGADFFI